MKRVSLHVIEGTLECVTAFRVGGSQDDLSIQSNDLPVIKDRRTGLPYVPGSSLKGKMRSEIEKQEGRFGGPEKAEPCGCAKPECPVCRVFGPHKNTKSELGPTRLLVRDAHLIGGEGPERDKLIEIKTETAINRRTGAAFGGSLRTMERVSPGSKFHLEMVVQVYERDLGDPFTWNGKSGEDALLTVVRHGIGLVEQTGLGAGTSRGSGKVRFTNLTLNGKPW
ncbi:MAG: type III-A CRISPR-associated RAMP protein Csm3 [Terriglobia bacterium]